jgi:hypothetical protein
METMVIRCVYPLAKIRRNTLTSYDLQASSVYGTVTAERLLRTRTISTLNLLLLLCVSV